FKGHAAEGTRPQPLLAHFGVHGAGVHRPRHRRTPVASVGWRHILRRVSAKLLQAVRAAEGVRYALVYLRACCLVRVNCHAANWVLHREALLCIYIWHSAKLSLVIGPRAAG